MKAAVVYYSRSGVTKKIAEKIQAKFNADMIFVEPEKAYKSFPGAIIRVIREKKGKKIPAPKEAPADFSAYDTVFIGFPVWAATIPDFLQEYIRQADLAGKRVIPFATAGNNGRDESLAALKALLDEQAIRLMVLQQQIRAAKIPVVILFMCIEKHLVSGLTSGGVKG